MAEATAAGAADIRASLDATLARTLPAVFLSASAIYAGFIAVDLLIQPPPVRGAMALLDAFCAVVLFAVWVPMRVRGVGARYAHAVATGLGAVVALEGVASLVLTHDPLQTVGFVLLLVGAGIYMLSYAWFATLVALALASWTAVAAAEGFGPPWQQFGMTLVASALLAGVAQGFRVQTLTRLERARRKDAEQSRALARAYEALEESRERYRSIIENTPTYIFTVGRDRRIDFINRAPPGLALDRIVGHGMLDLMPVLEERPRVREALDRVFAGGEGTRLEAHGPGPHGKPAWYEIHVVPLRAADTTSAMVLALDISERKAAEEAQRVAYERLAEINRLKEVGELKTRLLNTASHELNTPITPLKLQIHLLKSGRLGDLNDKQGRAVEMLDRNIERLSTLVQDVLDVARLQSGRLMLRRRATDVDELVREAAESFEEPARQAGVRLTTRLAAATALDVDPDRITQVLFNVLGNAVKFTPEGGSVEVETAREPERVVVRVKDTGIGLTGEQISRLFQPFGQVHDTNERTRAGTGLGLYISKGILEQHGGRIWAESPGPGKGATFAFALPLTARGVVSGRAEEEGLGATG